MDNRIIAHLDMDAFYAEVERRSNPQFAELPIVVGADPKLGKGRGVVATANYKARAYGIHSALPISIAWRLSQQASAQGKPQAIFLPPNFPAYHQTSQRIFILLSQFVPCIEQASVDEFYLDLSSFRVFQEAINIATTIKSKIKDTENLPCTIGIAPNKLIAKLITTRFKPDGLKSVQSHELDSFMQNLSVRDIPGIGPKAEALLTSKNIHFVSQLQAIEKNSLLSWFGKWGAEIYDKIRGIDNSEVLFSREIKSISEEETFDTDTLQSSFLLDRIVSLCDRVLDRMKTERIKGFRTVSIKIRFSDFTTKTRAHSFFVLTDNHMLARLEVQRLFLPFLDTRENPQKKQIRLIGVKLDNFIDSATSKNNTKTLKKQLPLFSENEYQSSI